MYNFTGRLVEAYVVRLPRPPAWYTLGLDDADQRVIDKLYHKLVSK